MMLSKPSHNKYDESRLRRALHEIRANGISIRKAASMYGVPRSTLHDKIKGKLPENISKGGPNTVLTSAEEEKIVTWCMTLSKCGFPVKKDDLLNTVKKIVDDDKRPNCFADNRPGDKWYRLFLKRHLELRERIPEGLSKGRAVVTEEAIRKWFVQLEAHLKEIGAEDVFYDPRRILNGDETSFNLCPKTGKVLAPKGYRNVYQVIQGNDKETITVLLVFTASGETVTPMVVFPYVRPPKDVINSMPPDWFLGRSESGWMKADIFFEYIANGVHNWLNQQQIQRPVLLFVDGHKSHLTLELSEFCHNNKIILYALPPNTTHLMQPADVSVFKPLKSQWKKTVRQWLTNPQNVGKCLTKNNFCPLLKDVLDMPTLPTSIRNGFRKCGLYPMDVNAVDFSKCIKNNLENVNQELEDLRNQRVELNNELADKSFDVALEVIKKIDLNVIARGCDVNIILEEIQNAKRRYEQGLDVSALDFPFDNDIEADSVTFEILEDGGFDHELENILADNITPEHSQQQLIIERASQMPLVLENTASPHNISAEYSQHTSIYQTSQKQHSENEETSLSLFCKSSKSCSRSKNSLFCSPSVENVLKIPNSKHMFAKKIQIKSRRKVLVRYHL